MKNNLILWVTHITSKHIYKIYSTRQRDKYYLYQDDKKVKSDETPEKFNDYIAKLELQG